MLKVKDYELVVASCTSCHSAKIIAQNSGDREYWESLIRWMQKTQGLWPLPPEMEDKILTYLATAYGEKTNGRRPPLKASLLPPPAPAPRSDAAVIKAREAVGVAKKNLKGALMAAMEAGGTVAAIPMCQAQAPSLTKGTADVVVGRTSDKLRNPANAGPRWATDLVDTLRASPTIEYLTTTLPDGHVGYVERIDTGALCLKCHGAKLTPETAAALAASYPADTATGFTLGEMRGVFWADVDAK